MTRFTVICPTYNRGPAIVDTLDSVRRQSLRDWELLVVSDASDDGTDDIVEAVAAVDSRVRLLRTRRFGSQAGPTNIALQHAAVVATGREREAVVLVAQGLSNAQIAARMAISPVTAKTHINRAMTKLHARDRAQLVVLAYESGLVTPRGPDRHPTPPHD
jgi:DNA-binding NarL/FixJ family response regulator